MINLTLRLVGVFQHAESGFHRYDFDCISLVIAGVRQFTLSGVEVSWSLPFFFICPRNVTTLFDLGDDRENWALVMEMPDLRVGASAGLVELYDGNSWIELPAILPVPPEQVPGWRWEFQRMRDALRNPIPRNLLRAKLGVTAILRYIIDHSAETSPASPAEQLKTLIDGDGDFASSLAELSERCCYSADHLRQLFQREYSMSPLQYRNQRRMALAMEYITNSGLSVKEIAARLHFEYVSHFSAMFRQTFGIPPSEGIRKYRFTSQRSDGDVL